MSKSILKAEEWFRKAAEQGMLPAQVNLGKMYTGVPGIRKDFKEALKWYHRAAEGGNAKAQNNLAVMYLKGHGVSQDNVEAYFWLYLASQQEKIHRRNLNTVARKISPEILPSIHKRANEWQANKLIQSSD